MKDILYPLRRLHGAMHEAKLWREKRKPYIQQFRRNPKTVFLVFTPEHDNIGDHGIAWSETIFLKDAGFSYIEITGRKLKEMSDRNELNLMNGFPIIVNGGGYLGTLWLGSEFLLRNVINNNPKSTIICLPNTIYYEDSDWGREEFEKSKTIYNRHRNLFLYAREKRSFEVMQRAYRNVKLVPDMVLYLNECRSGQERHGCLLCLRSDRERTRTEEQEDVIRRQAEELFGEAVSRTDMIAGSSVPVSNREKALQEKFDQFRSAELVITDRLHGMIFCAVTGTPCVVVDSKSPKVRGCYEWIKDLDYIRFADDPSQIVEEYKKIPEGEHQYNNENLMHYYQELADDILRKVIRR